VDFTGKTAIRARCAAHQFDPMMTLHILFHDRRSMIGRSVVDDDPSVRQARLRCNRFERRSNDRLLISRRSDQDVVHHVGQTWTALVYIRRLRCIHRTLVSGILKIDSTRPLGNCRSGPPGIELVNVLISQFREDPARRHRQLVSQGS